MRLFLVAIVAVALIAAGCQNGTDAAGNATPSDGVGGRLECTDISDSSTCRTYWNNGSEAGTECSTDSDCSVAGCSGQLCVQASKAAGIITTCEYREEYGCLKLTSCGCTEGRCAWAATEEYETCLNDIKK